MISTDEILALFEARGTTSYFGEPVTQTEHALQAAWLASRAAAPPALIAAALLHDVGHLLHQRGEDIADRGIDARHEIIGARWLSRFFDPAVTEPIRLHVAAKRYLCRVDPEYSVQLSDSSKQSLDLQGGALSAAEITDFARHTHWAAAVQLRRWDDAAKVRGLQVAPMQSYGVLLDRLARRG